LSELPIADGQHQHHETDDCKDEERQLSVHRSPPLETCVC
jgi:hypothetical protein